MDIKVDHVSKAYGEQQKIRQMKWIPKIQSVNQRVQ